MLLPRRSGVVLSALTVTMALVASLLLTAPTASAASTGRVRGAIYGASGVPTLVMQWFTKDWKYLGKRKVRNGIYSLNLPAGTYRLQFVDQRPAYNLKKYAPADAVVTVRAGHTTTKSVRMRRGAALYGVAKAGGKVAAGARVVAANTYQQSYPVVANKKGQFAIGGLPPGRYSVFTYDRKKRFTGKSVFVGKLAAGKARKVSPSLKVRAGRLLVDLYAGSSPLHGRVNATITSLATGQWWSANSSGGSVSFGGLYPGRYKISVPGVGNYFASTGRVSGGKVRAGRVGFGSYRLTKRGGWLAGTVVDGSNGSISLAGATVRLYDSSGALLDATSSAANGRFTLDGPLRTQSGATIVIQPGPYSTYLGTDAQKCEYTATKHAGISVTVGVGRELGALSISRKAGGNCNAPVS